MVSLCDTPANLSPLVFKSVESEGAGMLNLTPVVKFDGRDKLLGLVAIPEMPDAEGEVVSREDIEEAAHEFLAKRGGIDWNHDQQRLDPSKVALVESFIVQKGDPRFEGWTDLVGRPIDAAGAWGMVTKLIDPVLIEQARAKKINGYSMYGVAVRTPVSKSTDIPNPTPPFVGDQTMPLTKEDLEAISKSVGESLKPLTDALTTVTKALTPAAPVTPDKPKEFDPLTATDAQIVKHIRDQKLAELKQVYAEVLGTADGLNAFVVAKRALLAELDTLYPMPSPLSLLANGPAASPAGASASPVSKRAPGATAPSGPVPIASGSPWELSDPAEIEAANLGRLIAKSLKPETASAATA